MTRTRLLQAVCTVAMLAGTPAFAQSNAPADSTNKSSMSPSDTGGATSSTSNAPAHHAMTSHSRRAMHSESSQNSAVDRLNEQSYQAAQRGQAFNAADASSSGGSMSNGSSGTMNTMPNGSTGSMPASGSSNPPGKL